MRRFLAALVFATTASAETIVITNVTAIDPGSASVMPKVIVAIENGRIASIGAPVSIPPDAKVIDGKGKFLIPGLWDMHVHLCLARESALPLLLASGVTTVRDLGGRLAELDDWRSQIRAGSLAGPRILRAGPALNGEAFNRYQLVPGTPEETRGVVRALKFAEVDTIKVHRRMNRDSYFAAAEEAKKVGLPLAGHIPITVTPTEATDAGQSTIEHVVTLFEGTFSVALNGRKLVDAVREWRKSEAAALFARFVKNGTAFDPTLSLYSGENPATPPERTAAVKELFVELKAVVAEAHRQGVTLLAGSDVANDRPAGVALHDELRLLVAAGLTPMEALQTATSNPARVMKLSDVGALKPGNVADLVVLNANPLDDIANAARIEVVIAGGRMYKPAALKAAASH